MELSEPVKYKNYMFVHQQLDEVLRLKTFPTSAQIQVYREHLEYMRYFFPNFREAEPHIINPVFRESAWFAEEYYRHLEIAFTPVLYIKFLEAVICMVDIAIQHEDDFANLMGTISLKTDL